MKYKYVTILAVSVRSDFFVITQAFCSAEKANMCLSCVLENVDYFLAFGMLQDGFVTGLHFHVADLTFAGIPKDAIIPVFVSISMLLASI
ncbi:hypothetical protein A0T30_01250 [Aquipseudomonas alcaligenes]|nr:hypothetical protein A0T30_01250 [Pseudomonas alcaligenes]